MSQTKAMFDQAMALYRSGMRAEAMLQIERLAKKEPRHPAIAHAYASMLAEGGRHEQALYHASVAVHGAPHVAQGHQLMATILAALGRLPEAEAAVRKSLALEPAALGSLNTLGIVLSQTGRRTEAADVFERAMTLHPDRYEAAANYARLLIELGRAEEAVRLADRAVAACPTDLAIASSRAFILNYPSGIEAASIFKQHVSFGLAMEAATAPFAKQLGALVEASGAPGRVLRIGYLSSDLREHSVCHFVEHLFDRHDRSRFRVHLYHTHGVIDSRTERCRQAADLFRHVNALDDVALARCIRDDRVDVLVDLNGLSAHHRAGVLALRAAPVQVSYCGYCNTTGLRAVDVRIVDAITDPVGAASDSLSVERLARLDRCFVCFRPSDRSPEPTLAPDTQSPESIWFGSFNAPAKISRVTLDMWCEILNSEPRARMLVKGVGLDHPGAREYLLERFASRGVDSARVTVLGPTASVSEHLALYSRVQVALDTTPYAGTTTTCEALWMGVPVVTLRGQVHAARVGASLLAAVGRPEWDAGSPAEYVQIALSLGRDGPAIADLRRTLRGEFERSALRDEAGHTAAIETLYLSLWEARAAERPGGEH